MLKFGLETESCHLSFQNGRMDIFQFIDFAAETGYDGVMINLIPKKNLTEGLGALGKDDPAHIRAVADKIKERGLFVELDTRGTGYGHIAHILDVAQILGADLVRTFVMAGTGYDNKNLVGSFSKESMEGGLRDIKRLVPLLEKHRVKLAIENHCVETMEEIMELVDRVGSPWVGVLFDICNTLPAWEDPMDAAKLCADRIFSTHIRDELICPGGTDGDYVITGMPLGEGSIDVKGLCRYLLEHTTLNRFNLEMSYPYTGTFQRPVGTGGVQGLGEGAFAVKEPPLPLDQIKPEDYYLYEGDMLDELIEKQLEGVRNSLCFLHKLRDEWFQDL